MNCFRESKPVIGTLSLLPLPGAANWEANWASLLNRAEQEAVALTGAGVDGIWVHNPYDCPVSEEALPLTTAVNLTTVLHRLGTFTPLPLGLGVYPYDPAAVASIAASASVPWVRLPVLIGARLCESGWIQGRLSQWQNAMGQLEGQDPPELWVDVSLSHQVPGPQSRPYKSIDGVKPPQSPMFHKADGQSDSSSSSQGGCPVNHQALGSVGEHVIKLAKMAYQLAETGLVTGIILSSQEVSPDEVETIRQFGTLPVWVEGPMTKSSVTQYYQQANGLILTDWVNKPTLSTLDPRTTVDPHKVEQVLSKLKPFRETPTRQLLEDMPPSTFTGRNPS